MTAGPESLRAHRPLPRVVLLLWLAVAALVAPAVRAAAEANDGLRAQLTARRAAVLAAEVAARVSSVHVPEGGAFQAGDPLVSFDSALQLAQVDRARAVLAAAEKTAAANARLLALHSIGQVEAEMSVAEVQKAKAELAIAEAMLSRCQIKAPFSGRISEQRVREQEFVQPGQALLEIVDDAAPQVDFIAPSKWLAWLKPGLPIEVRIEDTGRTYAARIERVGAKADPVSQSVKIIAALNEAHAELLPGMSGTVVVRPPTP